MGESVLEVVASPNDGTVVVRNWHDIEILYPEKAGTQGVVASTVVDQTPNGASVSSTSRLAFSADGSELFYIKVSDDEPKLISMSTNDLHLEASIPVGPYPNAIAVVPKLPWVFVTAGFPEEQYLEAIDVNTRQLIFKAALRGDASMSANRFDGCVNGRKLN